MNIGDRVRDPGTQFVGTIIQFDPPTGDPVRCLIEADPSNTTGVGKVGDPPADKLWQSIGKVELVDMSGNAVNGKSAGERPVTGAKLAADDASATSTQRRLDAKDKSAAKHA